MKINPYLSFNGNCRQAYEYYHTVFGGEAPLLFAVKDSPMATDCPAGTNPENIMHACLTIGGVHLMGGDCPEQYEKPAGVSVNIATESKEEAERVFTALAKGGEVYMPLGETFWAEAFGMCRDQFGTPWMVNFEGNKRAA